MSVLGDSLLGSAAGALAGGAIGWLRGHPRIGAATGGALGGAAGVVVGAMRSAAVDVYHEVGDVVGFFPSYAELIGGPGPWTPQRMLVAQQYKPDAYGWTMHPSGLQSAIGPALARSGSNYGPAYLRMPADSTLPGSTLPPSSYFQQDVLPRAAEAVKALRDLMHRVGLSTGRVRQIGNACGLQVHGSDDVVNAARKVAAGLARDGNLAVVLVRNGRRKATLYFTDYPSMVMQTAAAEGEAAERVAGFEQDVALDPEWVQNAGVHYGIAVASGAAAGGSLALSRRNDVNPGLAVGGGAAMGAAIAYLTRAQKLTPPPGELPTEKVGREAVQQALAAQTGRWLNLAVWGPMMVLTGYLQPNPMASILSTTSGAVLIGSSALDIGLGYRLKMRHDAAVQARIDQYAVAPPKLSLRGRIARLKGST